MYINDPPVLVINLQQSSALLQPTINGFNRMFKNKPIHVEDIKCADGKNSQMACTDQKCMSYPFVCKSNTNCQKCHKNHYKCMKFIKLQNFLNQILQKNNISKQVNQYLDSAVNKWIDMISDTLSQIQNILKSYGLTKGQQQLLDLIQQHKFDKITGTKIKQVLREIDDQQNFANKQIQLLEVLQIQVQKTTNVLNKQLSKFNQIVNLARDGKAYQYKGKILGQGQRWNFDKSYKYASKFTIQNDGKMALKSKQHRMYSHIMGNKKFSTTKMSEFSILIMNSQQNFEMFGIGTKKIDRQDAHQSKDAILYLSHNGSIWHKGKYQKVGQRLNRNDMVTIRYDPQQKQKKVTWMKNYKPIASYVVPQHMLKYDMYPVCCLFSNGDLLGVVDYFNEQQ